MYQVNQLKKYFNENSKYDKIVNPCNTQETFDTLGTIDSIFRVFTSELLEIFNNFMTKMVIIKNQMFILFTAELQNVVFKLKGIFIRTKHLD